ncbi:MAG: lactoylglutathione lyase [Parvicella sp.]|jgi:lactoylglutathione lyase
MKFPYTILYVENVNATLIFYEKAFGFTKKFCTPENDYGEFVSGETTISFASVKLGKSNIKEDFQVSTSSNKPFGMELAFTSENIEADFEKALSSGTTLVSAIQEKPWGHKVGYVKDLNGFLIEICAPIGN